VFSAIGSNCFLELAKNRLSLKSAKDRLSFEPARTVCRLSQQGTVRRSSQQRTVISTEAAHAFVSSAAEKSASLPPPCPAQHGVLVLAFALAVGCSFVVIP
jgi:hypothetical protein